MSFENLVDACISFTNCLGKHLHCVSFSVNFNIYNLRFRSKELPHKRCSTNVSFFNVLHNTCDDCFNRCFNILLNIPIFQNITPKFWWLEKEIRLETFRGNTSNSCLLYHWSHFYFFFHSYACYCHHIYKKIFTCFLMVLTFSRQA